MALKNSQNINIESGFTFSIWNYDLKIIGQINGQNSNWQLERSC